MPRLKLVSLLPRSQSFTILTYLSTQWHPSRLVVVDQMWPRGSRVNIREGQKQEGLPGRKKCQNSDEKGWCYIALGLFVARRSQLGHSDVFWLAEQTHPSGLNSVHLTTPKVHHIVKNLCRRVPPLRTWGPHAQAVPSHMTQLLCKTNQIKKA